MKYDRNIEIMIEIKQLKLSAAPVLKLHVGIAYVLKLVSWNLSSVIHVKGGGVNVLNHPGRSAAEIFKGSAITTYL